MQPQNSMSFADEQLIEKLRGHFGRMAGGDQLITATELQKALGLQSEYLATRIFQLFDRDGNGTIGFDEFIDRVRGLVFGTAGRVDITAGALGVAREIVHERTQQDLVTGLRAKTHFGRPDWDEVLGRIRRQHTPEPVHVFFCGPEGLARVIEAHSRKLGLFFRQEHF